MSPIDHYYAILDSYCNHANINHINNDHPMARHFSVLFELARKAEAESKEV